MLFHFYFLVVRKTDVNWVIFHCMSLIPTVRKLGILECHVNTHGVAHHPPGFLAGQQLGILIFLLYSILKTLFKVLSFSSLEIPLYYLITASTYCFSSFRTPCRLDL